MELISRNQCVISGSSDLEHLYTFYDFPVLMGCVNTPKEADLKKNMQWEICKSSGSIQINPLIPPQVLYDEDHGGGTVGQTWSEYHKEFAAFISKHNPKRIFEIGGGHGILSKEYHNFHPDKEWTILEPSPRPQKDVKADYIKGYIEDFEPSQLSKPIDSIVHSYVIEHSYFPDKMIAKCANLMQTGNMMIISAPNMQMGLKNKYTNMLNFEHTFYIDAEYLTILLENNGLTIENIEYHFDEYSIFIAARKTNIFKPIVFSEKKYEINKLLFMDFINYYEKFVFDLNNMMKSTTQPIYLFGAHIFAQFLIAFGLDTKKIICLLDNDINKQNKRLYGTSFEVQSPTILKNIKNPALILKAGVYNNEIKRDITNNINPNVVFWE